MNEFIICDIGQTSIISGERIADGWCSKEAVGFYAKSYDERVMDSEVIPSRLVAFARCAAHNHREFKGCDITREQYIVIRVMTI
jgi:hypothetical protein